jgi:hypothetical protein
MYAVKLIDKTWYVVREGGEIVAGPFQYSADAIGTLVSLRYRHATAWREERGLV